LVESGSALNIRAELLQQSALLLVSQYKTVRSGNVGLGGAPPAIRQLLKPEHWHPPADWPRRDPKLTAGALLLVAECKPGWRIGDDGAAPPPPQRPVARSPSVTAGVGDIRSPDSNVSCGAPTYIRICVA
jgi:hypothetical protein